MDSSAPVATGAFAATANTTGHHRPTSGGHLKPSALLQVAGGAQQAAPMSPVSDFSTIELLQVGLLISVILISVVGNCLVCIAIFTDRRLRKLGNAFIVSLAIADLFVSCLVMTFALCNDLMNYWIFGDWFCDVWISFDIMCCTASILNLCAISLDRFVHIKDCLLYNQWMTRRVAISAVIIIWFISALVSFVPINLGWHKPNHFGQQQQPSLAAAQSAATANSFTTGAAAAAVHHQHHLHNQQQPLERSATANIGETTSRTSTSTGDVEMMHTRGKLNYLAQLNSAAVAAAATAPDQPASFMHNEREQLDRQEQTAAAAAGTPIENQSSPSQSTTQLLLAQQMGAFSIPTATNTLIGLHQQQQQQQHRRRRERRSANSRHEADFVSSAQTTGSSSGALAAAARKRGLSERRSSLAGREEAEAGAEAEESESAQFNQVESNPQDGSQIGLDPSLTTTSRLPLPTGSSGFISAYSTSSPSPAADLDVGGGGGGEARGQLPQCMLTLTPTYAVISSTISFYIPCIIMLGLYTKLFVVARRHVRNIQAISKAPAPITAAAVSGAGSAAVDPCGGGSNSSSRSASWRKPPGRTWLKFGRIKNSNAQSEDFKSKLGETNGTKQQQQHSTTTATATATPTAAAAVVVAVVGATSEATAAAYHHQSGEKNSIKSGEKLLAADSRQDIGLSSADQPVDHSNGTRSNRPQAEDNNNNQPTQQLTLDQVESIVLPEQFARVAVDNASSGHNALEKSGPIAQLCHPHLPSARVSSHVEQLPVVVVDNNTKQLNRCQEETDEEQYPFLGGETSVDLTTGADNKLSRQPTYTSQRSYLSASRINFVSNQQHVHYQQQQQQSGQQLATHKAAVTLGIIMGTFLFCWVPFFCLNIIKAFCVDCIPSSMFRAFTWLGYANSALNPIIYGIHNSEFRCAFNRIFFKHLNIKNSRYYLNRRFSYDQRHQQRHQHHHSQQQHTNSVRSRARQLDSKQQSYKSDTVT